MSLESPSFEETDSYESLFRPEMRRTPMDDFLIMHTESSRGWGGQEIRVFEELLGMAGLGFRTCLAAPEAGQIYQRSLKASIPVLAVPFSGQFHPPSFYRLVRSMRKLKPRVVNTHSSKDSWIAGLAARVAGVPLIVRTRHLSTRIKRPWAFKHLPHKLVTTGEKIRRDLIGLGVDSGRVVSIPTGIDPERFRMDPSARERVRSQFGIKPDECLVGNICVLRKWKGLDFFFDVCKAAPDGFRFMAVGDGPQWPFLSERIRAENLSPKVIMTGYQTEPNDFHSAFDIFFLTSFDSEGVPQSLLQAMSCERAVVATSAGSVPELFEEGLLGRCVQYGDLEAALSALNQLRMDEAGRKSMGSINRELVLANHGLDSMLRQMALVYTT
jgi:glycosyltransferase involved in cell wall biosynthesis